MNRRDIFILSACILFLFFLYFSNSYEYFRSSNPIPTLEDLKDIVGSKSLSHWKLKTPNTNIQKLIDYFKNVKWDPSVSPEDKQGLILAGADRALREMLSIFRDDPIEGPLQEASMGVWTKILSEES